MRTSALLLFFSLAIACGAPPTRPVPSGAPPVVDFDTDPAPVVAASTDPSVPFYPGAHYDPTVPPPEVCLGGHAIGARLARPEAIVGCFQTWAKASPRAQLERYARSYEGRDLVRVVISTPENLARLDDILARIARLADPRGLSQAEADRIIADTPAIAWFGYSIHGDEVSGADASLAFGYHLIASTDQPIREILERVVVVIDPVMNPDGRGRIISQIEQSASLVPNLNDASMHRGRWPWGRGNHYLFDMNRDWLVGAAPETRGRWRELRRFNPQLMIDAHEMGAEETYLFYPHSQPINPHLPETMDKWHQVFAADQARAFDAHGWAYYTREWADGWYPGYTDSWISLLGAVGLLYEQASTRGLPLRRASGRVVGYRETVHAQAVSSMTNLRTLAANREPVLRDYLAFRRQAVTSAKGTRTFALRPGRAPDRERLLITTLMRQGVEVYRADADFTARNAESSMDQKHASRTLPKGTLLIPTAQPQGALAAAMLAFDTRLADEFLSEERAELERKGESKLYDVTAWNLGQAFALDAYWLDAPSVPMTQITELGTPPTGVIGRDPEHTFAWVVDGRDDASVRFAVLGLERGLVMHVADQAFHVSGREFSRGSVLVRRGDNQPGAAEVIEEAARRAGVQAIALASGRSTGDGPDLGADHFRLVHRPRIAVIANWPVSASGFGHIWYQLDRQLEAPLTLLDAQLLQQYDLRRYNIIVLPPAGPAARAILEPHAKTLAAWVRAGGTLIAIGSSAAMVADEKLGLSDVRLRRDVLEELPLYRAEAERELAAGQTRIDADALWKATFTPSAREAAPAPPGEADKSAAPASKQALEAEDAWMRRFEPRGVMLRGLVDQDSWLTLGYPDEIPVYFEGDHALMARSPVSTAIRLARGDTLRLSGLLWPEARARLATTAYVTTESVGAGQVILFAAPPSYRAHYIGTARLFANAIVYGPSLGASPPLAW